MKKFRYTVMILLCGLMSAGMESCDDLNNFLEKPASDDTTIDDVFASRELAVRAMTACYVNLPFGLPAKAAPTAAATDDAPNKPLVGVGQGMIEELSDLMTNLHGTMNGPAFYYYNGVYSSSIEASKPSYVKYSFAKEGQWVAIRRCWSILENIDNVPDMSDAEKRQFKAEARVIIALHYTEMLRHLGGVPKVDHVYLPNEDLNSPRMTIHEMLEWIDGLIEESYRDLPYEYSDPNMYGRLTRTGALAIRLRAFHFAASPLFNDTAPYMEGKASEEKCCWLGEKDPKLWEKTRDLADVLIAEATANGYGLVQPATPDLAAYRAAYRKAYHEPDNGETLVITRCEDRNYVNKSAGYFMVLFAGGAYQPTQNWVDMFPMANGFDIKPDQPNYASGWDEQKPVDNRDPRLYETVAVNNGDWGTGGNLARFWQGGPEQLQTNLGYHGTSVYKFCLGGTGAQAAAIGRPLVWPWMRLAEVYLIYAEAANQYEGAPSPQAYARVNAIRERVGLSDLPDGMSKDNFHRAVMKERCCELGMENVRWFDIVRWKMEDVFKATLREQKSWLWQQNPAYSTAGKTQGNRDNSYNGDYLIGDGVIGQNGVIYEKLVRTIDANPANVNFNPAIHVITYEYFNFPDIEVRVWAKNFSPKWYLSAFPMNEVNKDYGLIQNPGW